MRVRSLGLAVGMVVAALGAAACGGEEKRLTRAELTAQGDAVCADHAKRFREAFAKSDLPKDRDLTAEEKQSFVKAVVPVADETIRKFRELNPPKDLDEQWDDVLAQAEKDRAELVAAGKTPADAERVFDAGQDPFAEFNQKLEAVGVTECSDEDPTETDAPNGVEGEGTTTTAAP